MTQFSSRRDEPSEAGRLEVAGTDHPTLRLSDAIEQALDEFAESAGTEERLVLDVRRGGLRCLVVCEPRAILSPREMEIARMVAQGHPTKRIANILEISGFTVNSHLRRIFMKLGVTSRPAMVAQLAQHGIVDLTPPGRDVIDESDRWDHEPF